MKEEKSARLRYAANQLIPRNLYLNSIEKDLQKKMVFLGGPRQVGKTTLASHFLNNFNPGHPAYLNWDNEVSRRIIQNNDWPKTEPVIVFDEIHKRKGWQGLVKGIWDTWKSKQKFIVTGSARLNVFRKGGDSMLGRYHYYRIHPFSLPELGYSKKNMNFLFEFGGFPEPLLTRDRNELRRWHLQRVSKLVRIDLRDLEKVEDLDKVEILADSLVSRVASPLSYKSLAEDLQVSDKTVKRWVQILDYLYYCYLIGPYGGAKIKSVKKAHKLYLWDWSQVEDPGPRFENMVASHLLKLCDFWQDALGYRAELKYLRSDKGKEVDFVVLKDRKPVFAVECKLNSSELHPTILEFKNKLDIPIWYQVHMGDKVRSPHPQIKILPFEEFCKEVSLI